MATHSSVLAWRIPGMEEPGGLPSMGSHRVGHDGSNLAVAVAVAVKRLWTSSLFSTAKESETSVNNHLDFPCKGKLPLGVLPNTKSRTPTPGNKFQRVLQPICDSIRDPDAHQQKVKQGRDIF